MKSSFLFEVIVLFISTVVSYQAQVKVLNPINIIKGNEKVTDIQFVNQNTGWFLKSYYGSQSELLKTTNGSKNFTSFKFGEDVQLFYTLGENEIYTLSHQSIFHSSNAGNSWNTILTKGTIDSDFRITSLSTIGKDTIYVFGYRYDKSNPEILKAIIIKSFDHGNSWKEMVLNDEWCWFSNGYFINGNLGWTITRYAKDFTTVDNTDNDYLMRTTNSGTTWDTVFYFKENKIKNFQVLDKNILLVVTFAGNLYKTTDAGINWTIIKNGLSGYSKVYFSGNNNGFCSIENKLYTTSNGGIDWTVKSFSLPQNHDGVVSTFSMISNQVGYFYINLWNYSTSLYSPFLFKTTNGGQDWISIIDRMLFQNLSDITFADSLNGWVCGESGSVLNSKDGGISWAPQISSTQKNLKSIYFSDVRNGWAVGENGTIISTINGGNSWSLQNSPVQGTLNDVFFYDNKIGWACGNNSGIFDGVLIKTIDGGKTWYKTPLGIDFTLNQINFINDKIGWVVGNGSKNPGTGWIYFGGVFQTTDGGESWNQINSDYIDFISFIDKKNGYRTANALLDITNDEGITWKNALDHTVKNSTQFRNYFTRVNSLNKLAIFFIRYTWFKFGGFEFVLYYSTDAGTTWKYHSISSGLSKPTVSNFYISPNMDVFIVGSGGYIWKIDHTDILTIIENDQKPIVPSNFSLSQNYPNPFNPSTTIDYQLSTPGFVTLKVYDLLGREVATLVDEFKNAGSYNSTFNTLRSSLTSGVYFYRLQAGSYSQTKKLIFMK